jgi:hypothetical protein
MHWTVKPGMYCIVFFPQRRRAAPNHLQTSSRPKKNKTLPRIVLPAHSGVKKKRHNM